MNAKKIAEQLARRVEEIAREWYPQGQRDGHEWRVGSVEGETGKSLGIRLTGEKAGVWCDFATGAKGDLLDLWCLRHVKTLPEALRAAREWLGLSTPRFYLKNERTYQKPKRPAGRAVASDSAVMQYLTRERKLTLATLTQFKIAEQGRTILFPYLRHDELLQVKYLGLDRPNGKKQIRVEADCEPCLFGWQVLPANTRTVTLTEGEIDAMTLTQYGIPALSVPFGGGSGAKHQWLEHEFDRLTVFDEIYLCFDSDHAGQEATEELIKRLGSYRCKVVHLPYKDANECLQRGLTAQEMKAFFQDAQILDPEELKSASLYAGQVIRELYPPADISVVGITMPWDKAKNNIRFRPGELSLWTGVNGHGKSQFIGHVLLYTMKLGLRVCIASLELSPARLLARLVRQAAGLLQPSEEYIQAIHDWYKDKLWLFDLVGTAKVDRLLEVFLYARQRYGVEVFVIDSLMKCGLKDDDYNTHKAFAEQLCDFKNQHNCHIHLVAHPRKTKGEDHIPTKDDIKGTMTVADLADNCFTIWRNKAKERALSKAQQMGQEVDPELLKKWDCLWVCDKQRNGDWEGTLGFMFDKNSLQYLAYPYTKPTHMVPYSKLEQQNPEVVE